VLAALLLILFSFRPGVAQLRNRIARSIGSALGRRVSIDNVRIHILPRPGFDLGGLVIYDAPAFSAEPMIRAQDVFAAIRLRSLLMGRLEIATLSATEPSVNIVRNSEGRWNLASLIERNAQIPAAPTQNPTSEHRPAFPYLEATGARINFKIGPEKKPYALTNADVALWQDSDNSWSARMKAQPMRTDFNLTDAGQLQLSASWQRAQNLRQTPLHMNVTWTNGQLGQITQLLTSKDRGWRGGAEFTATFSGTPEALTIESHAAVTGFHRYDIVDTRTIRLATGCTGTYNAMNRVLTGMLCESPVGTGKIRVRGSADIVTENPNYDLTFSAEKVPVASTLGLLREAKQQLPGDLTADGLLNAEFRVVGTGPNAAQWTGNGQASDVRLISSAGKDVILLGDIPLTAVVDARCCKTIRKNTGQDPKSKEPEPAEAHLRIGPVSIRVNNVAPMNAGGWIASSGYRFFLRGATELENLFRLENSLGIPSTRPAAEGSVQLDLALSGAWRGFAAPLALGTAQLRNVRAEMHGLNTPIKIATANLSLAPDALAIEKLSAQTGSTRWSGSVSAARRCAPACDFQVDLTADHLSTGDLAEWLVPEPTKKPWYRILSSDLSGHSPLLSLRAHGNVKIGELTIKKVAARQMVSHFSVDRGKITFTSLRAQLLLGNHQGDWTIDTLAHPPSYHGKGTLQNVSLAQVASLMNTPWVAGTADGNFQVESSGLSVAELLSNADGKLQFTMRNGAFPRIEIPGGSTSLPVRRFSGDLLTKKGDWEVLDGKLQSRDAAYQVNGTAMTTTEIDFKLTRKDSRSWRVTGTLANPKIGPIASTATPEDASKSLPSRP